MADYRFAHHRYAPPLASDFGTIIGTNSQTPTLTDAQSSANGARGLVMDFGNSPATGFNVRQALKSKTAGSSQDIIIRMRPVIFTTQFQGAGIVLRESSSGKLVTWGLHNNGCNALRWTSEIGTATQIGANPPYVPMGAMDIEWFKISLVADDPKHFSVSRNGTDWVTPFADATQTAFFTFNQVGVYVFSDNAGAGVNTVDNKVTNSILYFKDALIDPGF